MIDQFFWFLCILSPCCMAALAINEWSRASLPRKVTPEEQTRDLLMIYAEMLDKKNK